MTDILERTESGLGRAVKGFLYWYDTPEGTQLPTSLTPDDAIEWASNFRSKYTRMQWKLVDFIQQCRGKWGEMYVQIAEETGLSPDRLKVMLSTGDASRVTRQNLLASRPDTANVPFSFFEAIAPDHIPQVDKERLIVEGMEAGLSRDNFREYVKSECPNPSPSSRADKEYRAVLRRYHALVDKTFLDGLSEQEADEKEALRKRIDVHNAPFYEGIERSRRRTGCPETCSCLDTLCVDAKNNLAHLRRYWKLSTDRETVEKALASTVRSYKHKPAFQALEEE